MNDRKWQLRQTGWQGLGALALALFCLLLATARYRDTDSFAMFSLFAVAFAWSAWRAFLGAHFRFSVKEMLVAVAVLGAGSAWVGSAIQISGKRSDALRQAEARGAFCIHFAYEHSAPALRSLMGDRLLFSIYLSDGSPPDEIARFLAAYPEAYVSTWGPRDRYKRLQNGALDTAH